MRIAIALALILISGLACATNYFSWGVENLKPSWGVNGTNVYDVEFHGGTTRDCTVSHSGSCSMKLPVIGNDGGNGGMGADFVEAPPHTYPGSYAGGPSLYYRWWMRIMPGFSWGNSTAKVKSSRTSGSSTYPRGYTGYLMDYGFLIGECEDVGSPAGGGCVLADGSPNTDSNLYVPYNFRTRADGLWHEYIVRIKPNTSASCTAPGTCDAQLQAWVDGVSVGQYNNFRLTNKSPNTLEEQWGGWMVYPYFQLNGTVSDGGTIYVDDFSTDDTWNSIYSGGSDSTPPSVTIATADPSTISADSLTATGTASDGTGVSGCKWRVGSAPDASNGTACTGTTSFSCSTSGYSEGANTLYVGCYDAAGNYGSDSTAVNRDSTAPTTPTDLDARSSSTSTVDLSWQPSTDAVGVTSYRVDYCSGYNCSSWATLGTSATNSYTHTGITPAANPTIYRYRVYALDAANNLSGAATSIHFNAQPTIPAFPGAEGGGAYSKGGRGGTVYHVTSLLGDTSAGTLRACVNATGPRTCVFDVGGTIELTSNVNVSGPYITIAGDTAPGGGIAISGKNSTSVTFTVRTHNVIVRGIRFRKGYNAGTPDQDGDSSNVTSASATSGPVGPIIFDHVSSSWTQDENAEVWSLTTRAPKDVTYQWAMFYEPFLDHPTNYITGAYDPTTANNMTGIDVHHSIFSQSGWRNPLIKNKQFRLVNNLIYNWSRYATMIGGGSDVDVIGNTYKQGPRYATGGGIVNLHEISVFPSGNSTTPTGNPSVYAVGNKGWNNTNPLADNWSTNMVWEVDQENGTDMNSLSTSYRRLTPLTALPFPITVQDVATAETIVLAGAGASRRLDCAGNWVSIRDSQDSRIVSEYTNNTGALTLLSSETEVGGYPTLAAGTACTDTDGDGMPDTWETANGLNASSASDGPTLHASGYSNLEMYLAGPSSETTPVLSNLLPTSNLARTATSATLQATTDQTATCRYALGSGTPYAGMTLFSNTASTTHSSSVSVVAGGVYQYCVRCMGTSLVSDESCTRFAVDPNPKKRVRH